MRPEAGARVTPQIAVGHIAFEHVVAERQRTRKAVERADDFADVDPQHRAGTRKAHRLGESCRALQHRAGFGQAERRGISSERL